MRKENSIIKFTAFVLLLTMVVLCLVSGTFAKYTSHFDANDTAIVARWDVASAVSEDTFDIFDVSEIYDTLNADYADGEDDEDVRNGENGADVTGNGIIAPGTWGKFTYVLTNNSDVSAHYTITYDSDEAGVFLLWSNDGENWYDDVTDLNTDAEMEVDADEIPVEVYWKWSFEADPTADGQSDVEDTKLGEAMELAQPTVSVDVDFVQVD